MQKPKQEQKIRTKTTILEEVIQTLEKREHLYGDAFKTYNIARHLFEMYLMKYCRIHVGLKTSDIMMFMLFIKIARLLHTRMDIDTKKDLIGYVALLDYVQEQEQEQELNINE